MEYLMNNMDWLKEKLDPLQSGKLYENYLKPY